MQNVAQAFFIQKMNKKIRPDRGSNTRRKKKPNNPLILRGTLAGPCKGSRLIAASFHRAPVTMLRPRHFPQEGVNFHSQSTSSLQIVPLRHLHLCFHIGLTYRTKGNIYSYNFVCQKGKILGRFFLPAKARGHRPSTKALIQCIRF